MSRLPDRRLPDRNAPERTPVLASGFRMTPSLARALRGEPVRVGTENPAKLAAVRGALAALCAGDPSILRLSGFAAASGVPDQPVGWDEIVAGARNRARAAFAAGPCCLAFGIEDGLVELPGARSGPAPVPFGGPASAGARPAVFNVGCAWVTDGEREGSGFSSGFLYPPAVAAPAFAGREPIGALFDALWQRHRADRGPVADPGGARGRGPAESAEPAELAPLVDPAAPAVPSGRQGGNIGQLTQGRLDRAAYGGQAILCALVPFLHADLYD